MSTQSYANKFTHFKAKAYNYFMSKGNAGLTNGMPKRGNMACHVLNTTLSHYRPR